LARTQELLGRYRVHLIDLVLEHVRAATASGVAAEVGDARQLSWADRSVDAVLDWAQRGELTADVAARLTPVLATGIHDPRLGFTDAYCHTAADLTAEVTSAGSVTCARLRSKGLPG
jgi:hypothetical protein